MLSIGRRRSPTSVGSLPVKEEKKQQIDYPPVGPEPVLLARSQVDELYDLLEVVLKSLQLLRVKHVVIGGTLLGAVRSQSFLFNDNDVDIAVIDDGQSHQRLGDALPDLLERASEYKSAIENKRVEYIYERRPWAASDRIVSSTSSVWIDVFVLCRYDTRKELPQPLNGETAANEGRNALLDSIPDSDFPLYHFKNQEAIYTRHNKYFCVTELFPLQALSFGHLQVPGPRDCVSTLQRFFGKDCFTHYTVEQQAPRRGNLEWIPLCEGQFCPVQHTRHEKRTWSNHSRDSLERFLMDHLYEEEEQVVISVPTSPAQSPPMSPKSGGLGRTRSLFTICSSSLDSCCSSPASSLSPPPSPKGPAMEPRTTKWFGADLARQTHDQPGVPVFDKNLRAVMEPHLMKARMKREQSRNQSHVNVHESIASAVGVPYTSLRKERRFLFDEHSYPLHEILAETLGVSDLSKLHEHSIQDKKLLLEPLLDPASRRRFHECYDSFVTSFAIPLLHSIAMSKNIFNAIHNPSSKITYRYQAFPCIRVVRPGEFSIGPHCDTAYGHSIGSLNFFVPLTAVCGTNALYTESHPGKEDWHPLTTKAVGLGYIFDGARCLHFTMESKTEQVTRVSLDFRIAIYREDAEGADLCSPEILEDRFSASGPGYYDEAVIDIGTPFPGATVAQKKHKDLFQPDARVGFPFTIKT